MLSPWKKSYETPRQCIKKQRHHFSDKGLYSQSSGFSVSHVQMWKLGHREGWVLKNCGAGEDSWESLGQSVLKEINPEYSLEGPILKFQYFGHLIRKADSLEKTLVLGRMKAGGEGDDRGWDGWMASPTQWTWVWVNSGSWWWAGEPGVLQSMGCRVGHDWVNNNKDEHTWALKRPGFSAAPRYLAPPPSCDSPLSPMCTEHHCFL